MYVRISHTYIRTYICRYMYVCDTYVIESKVSYIYIYIYRLEVGSLRKDENVYVRALCMCMIRTCDTYIMCEYVIHSKVSYIDWRSSGRSRERRE